MRIVVGTNNTTGKPFSGLEYLFQSIADILSTPLGSRVMLRDYGSRLYALVDAPVNQYSLVDLYQASVEAIRKWQPDFTISSVKVQAAGQGTVTLAVSGVYTPNGQIVTVEGVVI